MDPQETQKQVDLDKLEAQLIAVQQSTKTLWPIFIKLHNWLRMKSRWYYKWHLLPYAKVTHVVLLFVYLASLTTGVFFTQVNLVHAATVTWDGGGTDGTCGGGAGDGNKWSCAANWSGDVLPTSADAVVFNATSTKDATVDASFAGVITSLSINSGYTGTITLARSLQTTSTFTQGAGSFTMGSQNLEVDAGFTITAGTFNANTGTVTFAGSTATLACNNVTFNLVTFTGQTGVKTVNSNCSLPLGAGPTIPNGITLTGTLSGTGTLTTTTGTLTFNSGGSLSGFSGLVANGLITVSGGTLNLGSYSTVDMNNTLTISSGSFTAPSGTMTLSGALTISGSPTFSANGGTITFDGGGNVTLSCNNVTFNAVNFTGQTAAKIVSSNCSLPLGASPTIPNAITLSGTLSGTGTLTVTTGTLTLNAGAALSGFSGLSTLNLTNSGATTDFSGYSSFSSTGTVTTSSGTLTLPSGATTSAFTLNGGTFNAPSGTLVIAGTLSISGSSTFNHNNGTINFSGGGVSLNCNNAIFNLVTFTGQTGTKIVGSACSLPLGANPTIPTNITLFGILTGSGTLTLAAGTLTVNSTASALTAFTNVTVPLLTITGGTFTAPSGTLTITSNLAVSGSPTFNHNNGTVNFSGSTSASLSCGNVVFNFVTFTGQAANKTIQNNCSLPLGANPTIPTTINLAGTLSGSGTLTATAGTFTMNAGAALSGFSGVDFFLLTVSGATADLSSLTSFTARSTVNVSSGTLTFPNGAMLLSGLSTSATGTVNGPVGDMTVLAGYVINGGTMNAPTGTLSLGSNFYHLGPGTFNHNNGTVKFINNLSTYYPAAPETFNNVIIAKNDGQDIIFGDFQGTTVTMNVLGNLTLTDGSLTTTNLTQNGNIHVKGNIIQASTYDGGAPVPVIIDGTADQTLTGNATSSSGKLNPITINKSSGTLFLAGTIRTDQNWTYTAGTVDTTTNNSTVVFSGTLTLTGSQSLNNITLNGVDKLYTVASGNTVTALGTLTLTDGKIETGTIDAKAGVTHGAGFDGGSGLLTISGDSTRNIALTPNGQLPAVTLTAPNVTLVGPSSGTVVVRGTYSQSTGTFTGGAGAMELLSAFNQSGGTFTAPSGDFTVHGAFTYQGGTFNPNEGIFHLPSGSTTTNLLPPTLHSLETHANPIANWKFDESSGTAPTDSSGFGYTATAVGPTTATTVAPVKFSNSHSLSFDGVDDYLEVAGSDTNSAFHSSSFSLSAWMYPTGDGGGSGHTLFSLGGDNIKYGYVLQYRNTGDLVLTVGRNSAFNGMTTQVNLPTATYYNRWTHVAATYENGTLILYVNGVEAANTHYSDTYLPSPTLPLRIGEVVIPAYGNEFFKGFIDDPRIYDRPLTAGEVASLAAGNLYPSSSTPTTLAGPINLTGDLTLNGGVLDVSANNYAINVAGNWTNNSGTFVPRSGTVTLNGGNQTISGSTTFNNLTKSVTSANTLTFEAGSTQTITGTLNLQGTSGNLLDLRSSTSGSAWNIDPQGPRTLAYLDVKDSANRNATVINAQHLNVFDSGNNTGWLFDVAPELSLKTIGGGKFTDKTTKFTYYGQHPVFVGTGTAGAVVTVKSGTTTWCTTTIAADGSWSCRTTPTLAYDTDYPVTISATKDNHTTTLKTFTLTTKQATTTSPSEDLPTNAPSLTPNGSPLSLTINGETYTTQIFMTPDGTLVVGELRIKITNPNGTPLAHTNVTLHSDPQTVTTNAQGIATFANVPIGDHTLTYRTASNQQVTQPLTLQVIKDANGVPINVTVELKTATVDNPPTNRLWEIIIVLLVVILGLLTFVILKWRRQQRNRATPPVSMQKRL